VLGITLFQLVFCLSYAQLNEVIEMPKVTTNGNILRNIGIKTGTSISNQNWTLKFADGQTINNFLGDEDYITGLNFALNIEWFNGDYITLITDIGYIQKGFKVDVPIVNFEQPNRGTQVEPLKLKINYLYFSPQLKIRKDFNKLTPYAFVGPRIDYQLSYKANLFEKEFSDIEKDFNERLLGLNYGLGMTYRINETAVNLEIANFYDFTKTMDTKPTQNEAGRSIQTNVFALNLGITYFLKQN